MYPVKFYIIIINNYNVCYNEGVFSSCLSTEVDKA